MTEKRFDVVYEEDDEFENIYYWDIIDKKNNAKTSNELKLCHLLNNLNDENEQLKEENQALKNELNGMEQLLQSYRKTIKHDAELLSDATKNGYLPPLEDWRELK